MKKRMLKMALMVMTLACVMMVGAGAVEEPLADQGTIANADVIADVQDWSEKAATSYATAVDTENEIVTIATAEELALFANQVGSSTNYAGYTIKITDNVNLAGAIWTPINVGSRLSGATIDGDGHKITNMKAIGMTASGYGCGFIGNISGAITIQDITFDACTAQFYDEQQYAGNVGSIVLGYTYGTTLFDNVEVTNSEVWGFGKIGVMLGMGADPGVSVTFEDCVSENNTIHGVYNCGGLAGMIQRSSNNIDNSKVVDCTVKNVTFDNRDTLYHLTEIKSNDGFNYDGLFAKFGTLYYGGYAEYYVSYNGIAGTYSAKLDGVSVDGIALCQDVTVAPVAEIDDARFTTLAAAVAAAEDGDTITLLSDVTISTSQSITVGLTLDLNQHTISATGWGIKVTAPGEDVVIKNGELNAGSYALAVYKADSVTIEDLDVIAGGYAILQGYGVEDGNSTLYIEDGCYVKGSYYAIYIAGPMDNIQDSANAPDATLIPSLVVNGGEIICDNGTAIGGNGKADYTKITINGGEIKAADLGIYHPQTGELTINGGTITAESGIQFCCDGTLTMTGGTIQATAEKMNQPDKDAEDGDGYVDAGSAIVFISRGVQGTGYQNLAEGMYATISDGTLISDNNAAIQVVRMDRDGKYQFDDEINRTVYNWLKQLKITGGTFKGATDFAVEALAYDEKVIAISGGTYSVEPDEAYIVPGCAAIAEGDVFVVGVQKDLVDDAVSDAMDKVDGVTTDTAESRKDDINTAANTVASIPSEALLEKVEEVNALDELFMAANNLDVMAVLEEKDSETYTIEKAEVAGLGLSVYGKNPSAIAEDTLLTLEVKQIEAEDNVDLAFTAKPYVSVNNADKTPVANEDLNAPITFKIYLPDTFTSDYAKVKHIKEDGSTDEMTLKVLNDTEGKYIQITVTEFSTFYVTEYTLPDDDDDRPNRVTTYHDIDIDNTDNGTVEVNKDEATQNALVTITATPDNGYQVGEVAVLDEDGKEIDVIDNGDGTYSYRQPNGDVSIEVTFVEAEGTETSIFYDVTPDAYYYDAVLWAVSEGITAGMSDTLFGADVACTRAQAVTFLYRAAGCPAVTGYNPFTDVSADAYYYNAVLWAVSEGITSGMTETTFAPDATCTRGQIVTLLHRASDMPVTVSANPFSDVASDAYYYDAVLWAVSEDITAGMSDTLFGANVACTRAQIVTFLYRYMGA